MTVTSIRFLYALGLFALLVSGCGDKAPSTNNNKKARLAFPVEVAPVAMDAVTYQIAAVGSVQAFEQVSIIARVPGRVTAVNFQEGEKTDTERILVEIEPERYRLNVAAAKATLAKTESMLLDAQGALARRETVNRDNPGLVRDEDIQTARAKVDTITADVELAKANLSIAKLDLRDAMVRSPVAGIIQSRSVQTGQYVQTGTLLATLLQRDPLLVKCQVPESDIARIKKGQDLFFSVDERGDNYHARIVHISAGADPNTRLVSITAHVDDPEQEKLIPGSFARIRIPVANEQSIVVPLTAVLPSERGFLAYVLSDGANSETVTERVLTLGLRTRDGRVEVRSGLTVGEHLVVRGTPALSDGATVKVLPLPTPTTDKQPSATTP